MRGFLAFLAKFHFPILFLILQIFSFILIVSFNHSQKTWFLNSSGQVTASIESEVSDIFKYFDLNTQNEILKQENTLLRNHLLESYKQIKRPLIRKNDTIYHQAYRYIPCNIVQASTFKTRNYLTVDVGENQGIKKGNGVISAEGVVGIVKDVSDNFAVVLPIINTDFRLSCRIASNNYYGALVWDAVNYNRALLNDIPLHVTLHKGDTLYTTGFSNIFPTGIPVGTILHSDPSNGENFYKIEVELLVDYRKLQSAYVIDQLYKDELDSLSTINND
ncbi:MAG: rod shape-determining protein MreC [Bacteroidales bacterium]|nr:rod shape-determining protein MreC [Bacteroidales bacterium]